MTSDQDVLDAIFLAITGSLSENRNGQDRADVSDVDTARRLSNAVLAALHAKQFLNSIKQDLFK
jgi:hypothetical protein